jgi:hypothetical protein
MTLSPRVLSLASPLALHLLHCHYTKVSFFVFVHFLHRSCAVARKSPFAAIKSETKAIDYQIKLLVPMVSFYAVPARADLELEEI